MSTYEYQEPSALEKITIRKTAGGGSRAFLFARDDISGGEAAKIRTTLTSHNMSCVPSEVDGRHCLEVRGCKNVKTLEDALKPAGLLKGNPKTDHSDNEKFSLRDKFSNNMVTIYGVLNVIADIGIIGYGHIKQRISPNKAAWEEKAAGYAYSAGSLSFMAFGKGDKSDYQARDVALKLRQELQGRGIELPPESAAMSFSNATQGQAAAKKLGGFLTKHGAEAGNIATGTAGAFILKGALHSKQPLEGALGATTLLSGYGAALVKEKAPDPENPPTSTLGKVKQWVQERPNRLAGYGYMASTVLHGWESATKIYNPQKGLEELHEDFSKAITSAKAGNNLKLVQELESKMKDATTKDVRKAYVMRGMFSSLNLMSEFILARASKGHGSGVKGNSTIEDTALAIVADAIVRQPAASRDGLIKDLGQKFLTNPDVLGGDPENMEAKLYERVHRLENNPWLVKTGAVSSSAAPDNTTVWADQKVQKLVTETAKAKPESYVAAVDKSRAGAAADRIPG